MRLSSDLISQFVKITNDDKKKEKETTIYGTTVKDGDKMYVRIDGSDILTPMASTASMKDNERVIVMIKNHQAIVTGNVTSKSASESSVKDLDKTTKDLDKTTKEIIKSTGAVDNRIVAAETNISELQAIDVEIKNSLTAAEADIDNLEADNITIHETLSANTADINTLKTKVGKIDDLMAIHEQKILWGENLTSGMYMTADNTITLAEAVSAQRHGIVLVFCAYNGTEDTNYNWQSFFVPKQLVAISTSVHAFTLNLGKFTYIGTKYLYINDTSISGHADNSLIGSANGITYANNKFVLRYVIGV